MRLKIFFTLLIVFALAVAASAQTKISGTQQCAKADQEHSIQIGDRPNHSFGVAHGKCTYTNPMEIAGTQGKETMWTNTEELSGGTSHYRGYGVDTMANGDKVIYRVQGTGTVKDGVLQSADEKWTLVGGTGKLKGVKGKVACKLASAAADGSSTWDCEGEYELPK